MADVSVDPCEPVEKHLDCTPSKEGESVGEVVLSEANEAEDTRCLGYNGGTTNGNKQVLEAGVMDVKHTGKSSEGMDIVALPDQTVLAAQRSDI